MDTKNWSNYVFPPLVLATAVLVKGKFIDGYPLTSTLLLTDLGLHITAYFLADVIVQFGVNKMFDKSTDSELLSAGTDIVIQPLLHGAITMAVRPMIHSKKTLMLNPITFFNSFVDGFIYNIVAKYVSNPLVVYFSRPKLAD